MGLKDCTHVFRLGGRCLYLQSHLVSPSHCVCNVFAHCLCLSVGVVIARLGKAVSEYWEYEQMEEKGRQPVKSRKSYMRRGRSPPCRASHPPAPTTSSTTALSLYWASTTSLFQLPGQSRWRAVRDSISVVGLYYLCSLGCCILTVSPQVSGHTPTIHSLRRELREHRDRVRAHIILWGSEKSQEIWGELMAVNLLKGSSVYLWSTQLPDHPVFTGII